ncbi:competence protein CoiA family protein [Streptomyces sp. NPDC051597]|uniref:competence protein CoiA family protein n=1 Tax=Streptomyces sp. NPDC051597 TaxID=3155049 RepID=UPI003435E77A
MGYTALHPSWGRLDASVNDLGCGQSWEGIHRVRQVVLTCPECGGRVFARVSLYGLRHFYHQVRPQDCMLANESPEHHLLKLELALAARASGWHAELEVSSQSGDWRADVLVYDVQGRPFMALEAQLSPQTPDEARIRTDRYARDGVGVCWFALTGQPWQRSVPSLLVRSPTERGEPWVVWQGMRRYDWAPRTLRGKAKWSHIARPLGEVTGWILGGQALPYTSANGSVSWTAPAYITLALERARLEAEAEHVQHVRAEEKLRQAREERRRQALARAAELEQERQAELERLAGFFRHARMDAALWEKFTQMVRSVSGKNVFYGEQSPRHGNGLLVYTRPRPGQRQRLAGVVCPDPRALRGWDPDLTILVPTPAWLSWIQAGVTSPVKVAVLNPLTGRTIFHRESPTST